MKGRKTWIKKITYTVVVVSMLMALLSSGVREEQGLGNYIGVVHAEETNNDIQKSPIKWRILSVDDKKAMVVSDICLDYKQFHNERENILWEGSTIRSWLNNDFYDTAFSENEKSAIIKTEIDGCKNDSVFLLSAYDLNDYNKGFAGSSNNYDSYNKRASDVSDYAASEYNKMNSYKKCGGERGEYWTRTSSYWRHSQKRVIDGSGLGTSDLDGGWDVNYYYFIRPAMYITLDSTYVVDAGTIDSNGNISNDHKGYKNPRIDEKHGTVTWDCVYLGKYLQNYRTHVDSIEFSNDYQYKNIENEYICNKQTSITISSTIKIKEDEFLDSLSTKAVLSRIKWYISDNSIADFYINRYDNKIVDEHVNGIRYIKYYLNITPKKNGIVYFKGSTDDGEVSSIKLYVTCFKDELSIPDDVWSSSIKRSDYISLDFYRQFYSEKQARKMSDLQKPENGLCLGFDYSSWLFLKDYINAYDDYNRYKVSAILAKDLSKNILYNGKEISAHDLIKYCFIYQTSKKYQNNVKKHMKKPCYNYDSFVSGVKETINKQKACLIWLENEGFAAHVVLAYRYEEEDKQCRFYIYNNENIASGACIRFFRDSKKDHYHSGSSGYIKIVNKNFDTRQFNVSYADDIDNVISWLKSGNIEFNNSSSSEISASYNENNNLLVIDGNGINLKSNGSNIDLSDIYGSSNESIIPITMANGESDSKDDKIISWCSSNNLEIEAKQKTAFSIISEDYEIEVNLPSGAKANYEDKSDYTNKSNYLISIDNPTKENVTIQICDVKNNVSEEVIKPNNTAILDGDGNGISKIDINNKDDKQQTTTTQHTKTTELTSEHLSTVHPLSKGSVFTDGKKTLKYVVTKAATKGTGTVAVKCPVSKKIKSVTIPATISSNGAKYKVTAIKNGAFSGCKKLQKVSIGKNVTSIGNNAFKGCIKLKTIKGGKNLTKIGAKAFYGCKTLKSVVIPAKVKSIGKQAYCKCSKLKTITIKTKKLKAKSVGAKAFKSISKKPTVKVPKAKKKAYKKWIYNKGLTKKAKIK